MEATLDSLIAELAVSELFRLERAAATVIEVVHGAVWVTEAGRPTDAIVRAGEAHRIDAASTVLIEAIAPARIVLRAVAPIEVRAARPGLWRALFGRRGAVLQ